MDVPNPLERNVHAATNHRTNKRVGSAGAVRSDGARNGRNGRGQPGHLSDIAGDVEEAILNGKVFRTEKNDPRGTRYVVEGKALDQKTPVGVVGRFTGTGVYLIITVYEVNR